MLELIFMNLILLMWWLYIFKIFILQILSFRCFRRSLITDMSLIHTFESINHGLHIIILVIFPKLILLITWFVAFFLLDQWMRQRHTDLRACTGSSKIPDNQPDQWIQDPAGSGYRISDSIFESDCVKYRNSLIQLQPRYNAEFGVHPQIRVTIQIRVMNRPYYQCLNYYPINLSLM